MRGNYISNLSLTETSGGWSGFNAAIFSSLVHHFTLEYVGPVSPPQDLAAKVRAKLSRMVGRPGNFQFFSRRRLERIAKEVSILSDPSATFDFFHGSTPWVAFAPPVPYACYLDVCFSTYLSVYHHRANFDPLDIGRIERLEAAWLRRATRVFFSSRWALEEAMRAYDLDRATLSVAGLGGHLPIPETDRYSGGYDFLFIALDFAGKGGRICVEAFRHLQGEIPSARLRIIGERPPVDVLEVPGVVYEGRLDKAVPVDLQRLQAILASAFALVHPTVKDATPQVIVEAAYNGCPVIAPRSFGIPEMVIDGLTGWLVAAPPKASEVADRMLWLCVNPDGYERMRFAARSCAIAKFTWARVGDRIASELTPILA